MTEKVHADKFGWNSDDFEITPSKDVSKGHIRVIHFSSNDSLPEKVRAKIPDAVAQDLFRQSFNAGITAGKSEMLSYAHAYKALSDAGYKQNAEQKWVQSSQGGGPAGVNIDVEVPIEKKFTKDEIETLAARAHSQWVQSMLDKGQKSRKSNKGEELMVPYYQLSEEQKEIDRNTVKNILDAIDKSSPTVQQVHVNRPLGSDEKDLDKGGPGSGPRSGQGKNTYSDKQLISAATKAGEKLYGKSSSGLILEHNVERGSLKDYLQDSDGGANYDTFDYVFKPSTGEGIDVADEPISASHADTDGKIYVAGANGIFVFDNLKGIKKSQLRDFLKQDTITMDVPLFLRMLETAREEIKEDEPLHEITERAIDRMKSNDVLTMDDYQGLVKDILKAFETKDDPGTQDVDPPEIMYYADPPTIQNSKDYRNGDDDQRLYPNHMQQKDDPGTQDVDPPYQNYAAVPNYLEALPAANSFATPGLVEKRISGGSQIPLNAKGEALAAKLGVCIAEKGGLDVLYCSDLARGEETAHEVAEANPHTVLAKPTKALRPWGLGSIEGKTSGEVKDLIKYYIEHPDERPPGKGAAGDDAETFNEATRRQLDFWKSVVDDFKADPTIKIGVICHGRGLDLFIAWVEAGCPDDFDVNENELFNPDEIDHASMMRFHKDKIDEVDLDEDDPLKPGVYPILHSLTDDDNDEGNADLKKGGPGSGPRAGSALKDLQNLHDQLKNHPGRNSMASDSAISSFVRGVESLGKRTESFVNSNAGALTGTGVKSKVREGHESMWNAHHAYGNTEVLHADTALSNYHTALLGASKVFGSKWVGKSQLYLPPVEVHKAAKSAYEAGVSVVDITSRLAEGEGITESQVREIAKFFEEQVKAGYPPVLRTTENAWGGFYAQKWVKRVIRKITAERVEAYPAWIGVDLDNTLAEQLDDYGKDTTKIGKPKYGPFFDAVKAAVKAGKSIRIFTARVAQDPEGKAEAAVKAWCKEYLGKELPVTHEKDPGLREFWDDKAHNPEDFKKSATRCMVCFDIPRDIAEQLAVPGGEDPGDMHVTLAYLGKEVPVDALDKLKSTVEKFAAKFAPIKGTLSGPARFHSTAQSDGKDVCIALFSSASMQDFRRNLVKMLDKAGFSVATNFSYTPHVTLKYINDKDELPVQRIDPADVVFSRVSVWYGEDISSFPLSGTLIAKRLITGTIVEATLVQNVTDLMQDKDSTIVWAHVSCPNGSQYGVFFDPKGKQVQLGDELSWENEQPSTCILGSLADGEITPGLPFFRLGGITDDYGSELSIEKRVISIAKETGSKQGSWVTVNGQHILIGPDGRPAGGNPRAYGRTVSAKVDRARKNAVLTGKHEQDIADRVEAKVAKAIGVPRTKNNSAFDLRNDEVGVEIKTMVTGKNDKITMGKSALGRKIAEMDAEGIKGYTVVADMRGRSQAKYYFSDRLGSLRIGTMQPMTLSEIKARINP